MLGDIDIDKLDLKKLILINSKLPWPKQKILGNLPALRFTVRMGYQIQISDKPIDSTGRPRLIVDSKKIAFDDDATIDFMKSSQEYYKVIGDGWFYPKIAHHTNSLYTTAFWHTQLAENTIDLNKRDGWCCTMLRKDHHRDLICELIEKKYLEYFNGKQWFCYDTIDANSELIKFMFRKPKLTGQTKISKIDEYVKKHFIGRTGLKHTDKSVFSRRDHELGPWHDQSLIELAPEGTVDYFEPTEKTVKPISAGMPFVMVASHRYLYRLRKMGFKTFHPFIDESYDQEVDWRTRTGMAVEAMFKFLDAPHHLDQIQEICNHNKKILQNIRKHDFRMRIVKKLKHSIDAIDN